MFVDIVLLQLVTGPISANLSILELLHLQVIAEGLCLLSILGGMCFAYYFLVTPWHIILCISIFGAIGCMIVCIISWHAMYVLPTEGFVHLIIVKTNFIRSKSRTYKRSSL